MVLVLDNYDSFTYNLVQYLGELGADVTVVRNDTTTVDGIAAMKPGHIVVSPGPGRPEANRARAAVGVRNGDRIQFDGQEFAGEACDAQA